MKETILELFHFLSIEFIVIFTAAVPVIELRGAIPIGISLGLSPVHSAVLGYIGSAIPVPLILFGIRPVFELMRKNKSLRALVDRIVVNSNTKHSDKIKKYGVLGLIILVAIPLPGTGVWSGSLVAALMNLRFKSAFPAIMLGNFIAAIAIMTLSHGVSTVLG